MTIVSDTAGARRKSAISYQSLVNAAFAIFIFFGMMSLIEPSPYDFMSLIAIPLWALGGFSIHRSQILILFLWCIFEAAGFAALMPYWDEADPRLYQFQSLYLFVTVIFFTLFFAQRTEQRAELCLRAYTAGAVLSAIIGILGYFDVGGLAASLTTVEGRVSGTFKDPNVLGSYLILSSTFLLQRLLVGATKWRLTTFAALLLSLIGTFVSYSRGSWGGTILSLSLMTIATYVTSETRRTRRRIVLMTCLAVGLCLLALLAILSQQETRDFFLQRATLTQDYDEGVTGRFGNQIRSLPLLLEHPEGLGPLRFRLIFGLEPHNSYIGAFANDGWIGGFAWILLVATSVFVGFRLMFAQSPYRGFAQIFFPTLFALLLQGFQIDVDHWRQAFLCFGAVWGLEAARQRWMARERAAHSRYQAISD
ncbi:MAG: O-antigen ligase family protein [Beijerinckiaceae bacterium]